MEDITSNDNGMMEADELITEYEHKYNVINIPWDDRSKNSKIGILALLITIFVVMIALVANSIVLHYKFNSKNDSNTISCHFVKAEEHTFVAKIFSTVSNKLLCVGAVLSSYTVLANQICTKSGAIRLRLGTINMPYCKKGFTVDAIEAVNGCSLEKLVILRSYKSFDGCAMPIEVGSNLSSAIPANILGRPLHGSSSFSRQPVTLIEKQNCTEKLVNKKGEIQRILCVQVLSKCPVRAGDLLIQNGFLYGLALANVPNRKEKSNEMAYFFDIDISKTDSREFENAI